MKMKREKAVQGTNDSSIVSKNSMVKAGYFSDGAVSMFVDKSRRRSPLINRGYYIRAKAVDRTVKGFLNLYGEKCQVLVIGAGFDSTYFRLSMEKKLLPGTVFFEVDFPDVVKRKRDLIVQNSELAQCLNAVTNSVITDRIVVNTLQYKLIGVNVKDQRLLNDLLNACEIDFNIPTLILSECVLSYLDSESGCKIIYWASHSFNHAVFACYEQIHPEDGFGIVMCSHFHSLHSPLKSVHDYPSVQHQVQRYLDQGWNQSYALDMNTYQQLFITEEEHAIICNIELFDEFEEWHMKCNHYVIVWAACGDGLRFLSTMIPLELSSPITTSCLTTALSWSYRNEVDVLRYGHTSTLFNGSIVSYGGFGCHDGGHQRLNDLDCSNWVTGSSFKWNIKSSSLGFRIHHTATLLSNKQLLICGGRSSPKKPCEGMILLSLSKIVDKEQHAVAYEDQVDIVNCCLGKESSNTEECPCRRWRHSANLIQHNGKEKVFIFGGRSTSQDYLDDSHMLDVSCCKWEKVQSRTKPPCARHSHSGTTWNNDKVIISCGLGKGNRPLSSIQIFSFSDLEWTELSVDGMKSSYSHTSHIFRNKLYLVGGTNIIPGNTTEMTIVDLLTHSFHDVAFLSQNPENPWLLVNHDSVLNEDTNEIIVIGGGGNCFSFGTHFNRGSLSFSI